MPDSMTNYIFYVHSSRLKKLADLARASHWNDSAFEAVLCATDEALNSQQQTFSFEHFVNVYRAVVEKSKDPCFGLHMGQDSTLAGSIGMMGASCANLKEAFEQGSAFFKMMGNISRFEFVHERPFYKMRLSLHGPWEQLAPDVAIHEVDGMLSFFTRIVGLNSHNMVSPYGVTFTRERLVNFDAYHKVFGVLPKTRCEYNEVIYREADMMTPMKAFNVDIFRVLKSHLEKVIHDARHHTVTAQVQSLLLAGMDYQFPDMTEIAEKLHMSPRSLQRKLKEEGTTFKEIAQSAKCELAIQMLGTSDLSISEIAYTLGYSDDSNFNRAFKKITGHTPRHYKRPPSD